MVFASFERLIFFSLFIIIFISSPLEFVHMSILNSLSAGSYKPAILDNGAKIQVPAFIESGDEIIIDTRSIEYIKKV